jgi:hypothetical protein
MGAAGCFGFIDRSELEDAPRVDTRSRLPIAGAVPEEAIEVAGAPGRVRMSKYRSPEGD